MSRRDRQTPESAPLHHRMLSGLLLQAVQRLMFPAGALLMAVGLALLSAAWVVGPRRALLAAELGRMTVPVEARLVDPYWALDFDRARWQPDRNWAALLRARPCVEAVYDHDGIRHRQRLCGAERGGRIRFELADLLEVDPLMAGVPLRWPMDADGQPLIELRMRPAVREQLAAIALQPQEWPEQPQSEAARPPPPVRSALDRVQVELDQPLEWLLRAWPAGETPTIPLQLDPQAPARALPAAVIADFRAGVGGGRWALAVFLLGIGVVGYGYGLSIVFLQSGWRTRGLIGACLLLAFPLWGGWTGSLLQQQVPEAWQVGREMAEDLASPGAIAIERIDPALHADRARMVWPAWGANSAYADLIAPLQLRRPEPPPADADAALQAATAQVAERLRALDDAAATALFTALAQAHREGRDAVGLLYVEAARELALTPTRPAATRAAAVRFLQRFTLSSRWAPHPGQVAYTARRSLWRRLAEFPADAAVANLATGVVARADAGAAEGGNP